MPQNKQPLYSTIYRHYKTRILSGELTPGMRLPTEKEISAAFKVSRITAGRALKELELENFIRRIKGSGSYVTEKEWESSPNRGTGEPKSSGGLDFISLILPFEEEFSSEYLKGIEDRAKKEGYFVTLHNTLENSEHEVEIIEEARAKGTSGLIIYPASETANLHMYSSLMIKGFPFVLIDREITGIEAPLVSADNQKGFAEITSHLIEMGHRKIVFVGTTVSSISSEQERYRGFCQAHIKHGIPLLEKSLYSFRDGGLTPADYRPGISPEKRMTHYLFDLLEALEPSERPTAIAAVNDTAARHIMTSAIERGIAIPGEYSLTGFDNLPYAPHLPVPLSTVEQPAYEIGRMAAEVLFRQIRGGTCLPEHHTISPSLFIRESTAPLT